MQKWMVIAIIVVFVLGLGGFLLRGKLVSATKDEANRSANTDIKTTTVERGDIAVIIDATGTIKPLNIVEVNSKASGKIMKLAVDAGDYVEEGDVIAEIETTYVQIDVDQAKADLEASQARLEQARTNIQLQKEQSQIQIAQAKEALDETNRRLEQLREQIRIEKQGNRRAVEDAENSFEMANLRYKLLTSETVRAEDINRAKASVKQAKANRDLADIEYQRKQGLFEQKLVSKSDLDAAEAQWKSADAQYQSAFEQAKMVERPASEAELALAQAEIKRAGFARDAAKEQVEKEKYRDMEIDLQKNRVKQAEESVKLALANRAQITLREKDLKSTEAQLRRSESQLQLANESLADTVIRAPIAGTILERKVEEGQIITSRLSSLASSEGQTLVTMADLSKVYVVTEVDETDIGKVRVGQPVTIMVEAYPDQPYEGEVLKIAPQGQVVQNVTTFEVITELKNISSRERRGAGGSGRWGRQRGAGGFSGQRGEITPEQRERRWGMRRQSQTESQSEGQDRPRAALNSRGAENTKNTPDSDTTVARVPAVEGRPENVSTEENGWGALFDSFFDEGQAADREAEIQSAEGATTPFLKPGMNATVEIFAASKQNALLIANEAILAVRDRKLVRVIGEDGLPGSPQSIVTGISSFDKTEVISGLEEGQQIAIGSLQRGDPGGGSERWRQMMGSPASTMRRMQRSGGRR